MGKIDDLQALKEWRTYFQNLKKDTAVDTLSPLERVKKLKQLEKNPVEWIKFFFGQYATHEFAPFHLKAIKRICGNKEWYEVLSWSRELAKSTTVMMCVMYLVCTAKKRNILLISNSKDNAVRLLKPYKDSFERNSLLKEGLLWRPEGVRLVDGKRVLACQWRSF